MTPLPPQTISDWCGNGYLGLRIMRCHECRLETYRTWEELDAAPGEDVLTVAQRARCRECGEAPAWLAVLTYKGAA
ncbi:hypothetical protein [Methylorubrum sp. POS3]|uniref:hypothetical protein n=1 Tax=Methylorubrum sp. POS3 TaxID=2998492 RepID=UPI003729D5DE